MNMNIRTLFLMSVSALCLFCTELLRAQSETRAIGFIDRNKDGINDRFCDADGDGINDLTGQQYAHSFEFKDKNGDGINDVWTDADGDGVNDRLGRVMAENSRWVDTDGDGIADQQRSSLRGRELMGYVLDTDQDGKNDITGIGYSGRDLYGYRFGNVDEENGVADKNFNDADGDGINDRFMNQQRRTQLQHQRMDFFIDADGDGIADDCNLQRMRGQGKRKGKK